MAELDLDYFRRPLPPSPENTSSEVDESCSPHVKGVGPLDDEGAQSLDGELLLPSVRPSIPQALHDVRSSFVPENLVPSAFRGIDFDKVETRTQLVKALAKNLPLNEYNLPDYYYRPDLLNPADFKLDAQSPSTEWDGQSAFGGPPPAHYNPSRGRWQRCQELLAASTIHLDYAQGFPALESGQPFWSRLAHESAEAFSAFLQYADLPGARTLTDVSAYPLEQVNEWCYQNYWQQRAAAMDMFRIAHHARLRERRILSLEGDHWAQGEKLFKKLSAALDSKTAQDLAGMDPVDLVNMLTKAAQLQRSAVGLSPNGGGDKTEIKAPSVEVTMRQIAKGDGSQHRNDGDSANFDVLLSDPDAINAAQELIIKVNK